MDGLVEACNASDVIAFYDRISYDSSPVKSSADRNDFLCYLHLLNYQVGTKVAAVSRKTNTTTHEILGVLTKGNTQIVCPYTKFLLCCRLLKNGTTSLTFEFIVYDFL
jgi:hypothetical protein